MRIETTSVVTFDGVVLAADIALVAEPRAAAVLAHPHPLHGGDRHHPLLEALITELPRAGCAALRFDFRGGGESGGEHDGGELERADVAAAVDALQPFAADVPLWLVGYSFGAIVSLNVTDPRVHGWIAVAPPLAASGSRCLAATDHRPKHLLVPEHDQFTNPATATSLTEGWTHTSVEAVPMADHVLAGRIGAIAERVTALVAGDAPDSPVASG